MLNIKDRLMICFFACITLVINVPVLGEIQQSVLLKEQAQVLLDEVLESFFGKTMVIIKVEALPGGHSTNNVTSLLIDDGIIKYVLRMKAEELSQQSLQCEYYAMIEAAKQGISPWIYFATEDRRAILMRFIEANTLTVAEANKPSNCIAIAKSIRKAHEIPQNPYFGVSEDEIVESVFLEISQNKEISSEVNQAIEIMRTCNKKLSKFDSYLVNNHGDLNSRNMFITPEGPILIDWEYTNWGESFEDLSYFSLRHNYDSDMDYLFLKSYLERLPSSEDLEKFYLFKKKTFAKLCIFFHYFSLKFNPLEIISNSSSNTWAEHMVTYSLRQDEMPPYQFYFELATRALIEARNIEP